MPDLASGLKLYCEKFITTQNIKIIFNKQKYKFKNIPFFSKFFSGD